jgi:hypothetical protein
MSFSRRHLLHRIGLEKHLNFTISSYKRYTLNRINVCTIFNTNTCSKRSQKIESMKTFKNAKSIYVRFQVLTEASMKFSSLGCSAV